MKQILYCLLITMVLVSTGSIVFAEDLNITIGTGGTAGIYYAMGGGLSLLLSQNGYRSIAQTTDASVANMRLLNRGRINMAFTQNDIAEYHYNGQLMFKDEETIQNYSALASLYPELVQIVVRKDSGIKTIGDLEGKKVGVGAPGSSGPETIKMLLEITGLEMSDIEPEYLSYGEAASYFKDRLLDAYITIGGIPHSAIQSVTPVIDVDFIRFTEEEIEKIKDKYPLFTTATINKGSYKDVEEDINTIAMQAILVVSNSISADDVYNITKSMFNNLDYLSMSHNNWGKVSLEKALNGITIPFHPGAVKLYNEMGLDIDNN